MAFANTGCKALLNKTFITKISGIPAQITIKTAFNNDNLNIKTTVELALLRNS
jgi:hypothetical protein